MAKIKPFKALIYNQEKVKNLSKVVCPPYDVISPQRQQYFRQLHPNNLIHILLSKDTPGEDKYRAAAAYFKEWVKSGVLINDDKPAIYFYSQQYSLKGEKKTRLGFIARLYLEERKSTFGHEHTHLEAKEDRFKLLKKVKANLSPIFVIFPDKKRLIQEVFQKHLKGESPFIDVTDEEGVRHRVWRLTSPESIARIEDKIADENIFIADGHHRYEVACAYRDEMKKRLGASTGEESFNYTLAYFTNPNPLGLTIMPIHRLARLSAKIDPLHLKERLREYFDVEDVKDKTRFFFLMEKGGRGEHLLGMYYGKKYSLLRLKNVKILDKLLADKPQDYRRLDVCILNSIILKGMLGIDAQSKEVLTYSQNAEELIAGADNDDRHIAFFLNPVKMEQIMSVAMSGDKMPQKSTYFYPKVLSGLVINKHEDVL